jgi:Reverse transcriptase (RNA-dependent DNA polymerase)
MRFTALLHHVDVDRLRAAYFALRPKAAPGVDGVTWWDYGEELEANLRDLHGRVHRGAYRARPSRRVYIPKADGRQRPLGVAALEDKLLQRAVVEVLNTIYESDFLGFSYGFRPGRSPHHALVALATGIERKKVNFVLDADIRGFFRRVDRSGSPRPTDARATARSRCCRHQRAGGSSRRCGAACAARPSCSSGSDTCGSPRWRGWWSVARSRRG